MDTQIFSNLLHFTVATKYLNYLKKLYLLRQQFALWSNCVRFIFICYLLHTHTSFPLRHKSHTQSNAMGVDWKPLSPRLERIVYANTLTDCKVRVNGWNKTNYSCVCIKSNCKMMMQANHTRPRTSQSLAPLVICCHAECCESIRRYCITFASVCVGTNM